MTNADAILPEFQNPQPGDAVKMCGGDFGPPAYIVALVKPGEYIVLGHHPQPEDAVNSPDEWTDSWAFVLQPVDVNTTRLLIRTRATMSHWIFKVIEPITFFYGTRNDVWDKNPRRAINQADEVSWFYECKRRYCCKAFFMRRKDVI